MAASASYSYVMFAFTLASIACASVATSRRAMPTSSDVANMTQKHAQWMAEHGRVYKDELEKKRRFEVFKANVEYIESANRDVATRKYKLAVNQFADLTNEEFKALHHGFVTSKSANMNSTGTFKYADTSAAVVPPNLDWRARGAVTPIKDQGQCGTYIYIICIM